MGERVVWNEEKRCHERFADLDRAGTLEIWECVSADEERRQMARKRKREVAERDAERMAGAERERAAFQMGYSAGRTDERMRQWREQTNGPASEDAGLSGEG
jgi:hypothetical protein